MRIKAYTPQPKKNSSGNVSTSALAALQQHVKQKGPGNLQVGKLKGNSAVDNELQKSAEKLGNLVGNFDASKDINYLKLLILEMAFKDPQLLHNYAHVICLSLDSQVTMETLMMKGPAEIAVLDSTSKSLLKKVLVDGKHKDPNPVFNKCIEHPVVLCQGPSGITMTNVTGSSNAVWTPNPYYAARLAQFGIPAYRVYRQDSLYFGFNNFGYASSPRGLHVYNYVNVNLFHRYLPLPKGESLIFSKDFISDLTKKELFDFGRSLDLEISEHFKYGTAVAFTETSRDNNLQLSQDIGGYCSSLMASDGQCAIEQFGLSSTQHKLKVIPVDYSDFFQIEKHKLIRQFAASTTCDQNMLSSSMTRKIIGVRSFYIGNCNMDHYQTLILYKSMLGGNTVSVGMLSIPHEKKAFEGLLFKKVLPPHSVKPLKDIDDELAQLCQDILDNMNNSFF